MRKFFITLIVLLLIPCIGYADSTNRDAYRGLLSHSIEMDSYECNIGETIDYKITFINYASKDLEVYGLTSNGTNYEFAFEQFKWFEIAKGKEASLELSGDYIHPFYQWYPKADGFYLSTKKPHAMRVEGSKR